MASSETSPPASETSPRTPPSLEELSRRGVRRLLLPWIVGLVSSSPPTSQDPREVMVLVNLATGSIRMIEGSNEIAALLISKDAPIPASKKSIEAMPAVEVKDEGFECAICLTAFEANGELAKEMPCEHRYHKDCIEKWLGIHGSCPICRYQMPIEGEVEKYKGGRNQVRQEDTGDDNGGGEDESDDEDTGSLPGIVLHVYVVGARGRISALGAGTGQDEDESDGDGQSDPDDDDADSYSDSGSAEEMETDSN